jgi:hypothetical protein
MCSSRGPGQDLEIDSGGAVYDEHGLLFEDGEQVHTP